MNDRMRDLFEKNRSLEKLVVVTGGMTTGNNDIFLRLWHEVSQSSIGYNCLSRNDAIASLKKWFPYNKGGTFRRWFGNRNYVVNWHNDGEEIQSSGRAYPRSKDYYFQESLTYSATSSSHFGIRYSDTGFIFDAKGSSCFAPHSILLKALGFLSSHISTFLLQSINPTIEFQTGDLSKLPFNENVENVDLIEELIGLSQTDWDSYEISWDFIDQPLLRQDFRAETLRDSYFNLRRHWHEMTLNMLQLEEENNRIFIDAYGLQDELIPDVPQDQITLTCNPRYRYGGNRSDTELENLILADTTRDFISYAVGCMFGRYALETPGLILANQGENLEDYLRRVPNPSFPADQDNVIPILDNNWFNDDIVERFYRFLRLTFGAERYDENLHFIEEAIDTDIRSYFVREFYNDHIRRYQKRPIYWLFSSPNGSFNALIYMHRYRPDTVSVVLNEYLREYRNKLEARISFLDVQSTSASASKQDKTTALKELEKLHKIVRELNDYERDVLYPLATKQVKIDFDDGVKVNYRKFGAALKPIAGFDD